MGTIKRTFFQHLWRSYTARSAGIWLAFWLVVIILGHVIIPDSSQNANTQILEYAKVSPGFSGNIIAIASKNELACASHWYQVWAGKPIHCRRVFGFKAGTLQIQQSSIQFATPSGLIRKVAFDPAQETALHYRHTFCLGSDVLGRDVLSRLFLGARVSLSVGFWAVLISLLVGVPVGLAAGYFGGIVDKTLMGAVSVLWAIPTLMLAMSLAFVLGKGYWQICFSIGLTAWVEIARMVRSQTLVIRSYDYIVAGKVLSFSNFRLFFRHILPNMWGIVLILAAGNFSTAILMEAGLSFLGMGVQPPTPSWGAMIYEGYAYLTLQQGKWLAVIPGIALMVNVIALTILGNELRDFINPQKRVL